MLDGFIKDISKYSQHKLLLTMSGGMDSTCLFHLLIKSNIHFSVAHCNFKLRGKDSDADEKFVQNLGVKHNITVYTKQIPLQVSKASIQVEARNKRYDWFQYLYIKHNFDFILTAHHLDDNIETFFLNMFRGRSIKSLSGMQHLSRKILRPLINFRKKDIQTFVTQENIAYRTDKSNTSNTYQRNVLRNSILPHIEKHIAQKHIIENIHRTQTYLNLYNNFFENRKHQYLQKYSKTIQNINTIEIHDEFIDNVEIFTHSIASPLGFNRTQIENMCSNIRQYTPSNKTYHSDTHTLHVDKTKIYIESNSTAHLVPKEVLIHTHEELLKTIPSEGKIYEKNTISIQDKKHLYLDLDKIQFPILLRQHKQGDVFCPLGMKHKKTIKKFLIDAKIPKYIRKKTYILEDNTQQIIAVCPYRISNHYKVDDNTKHIICIKVL